MHAERTIETLQKTGSLLEGHFVLTSGRHAGQYIQCARLFEYPAHSAQLCAELAQQLSAVQAELVVGPALGGVIFAYELARALGVRNIFAERESGAMTLRRGFAIEPGTRVVIAEDVVTTGGSVREVIEVVRAAQGEVVAVAAIADRSGGQADFGVPLVSLLSLDIPSYGADRCPLCDKGLPLIKPGSRTLPVAWA